MKEYDHLKLEKKWQNNWDKKQTYKAKDFSKKPKYYSLIEFPYPSGDGLHVGHPRPYIGMDVISRKKRQEGFNVLYPIGWDAFGLPTENYAIKTGQDPRVVTKKNSENFKRQIKSLGISFDWSREINTTDPKYYKWTQWIFLQFLKKGLAYKAKIAINWCPKDKIGLANEEVVGGCCERCGTPVEKREKEQWMLGITKYAERLDRDLDSVDYLPQIKLAQRNWIGKSEGAEIEFPLNLPPSPLPKEGGANHYVLLHGFNGTPDGIFFKWLKEELKKRGLQYQAPQLPNSTKPNEEEQVNFVLKNCKFDENTILFGHSLGAVVAMKVLEKLDRKIAGLVLAGGFIAHNFKDRPRPFDKTFKWQFDFEKIKSNANFIKVLSDPTDYAVPIEQGRILKEKLSALLVEKAGKQPHFTNDKEPLILETLTTYPPAPFPWKGQFGYHTTDPKMWRVLQDKVLEMRKNPTTAEEKLWQTLRKNLTGYHFRRQHIIERFIVDFVCLEKSLVIEVDGDIHDYQKREDKDRTDFLKQNGFRVMRFRNEEVLKDLPGAVKKIEEELKALPLGEGLGGVTKIFTTRPDTIFGATYLVLAPEHELVQKLKVQIKNWKEVEKYVKDVKKKTDIERTNEEKIKTGIELKGIQAINPASKEEISIWIADYVLPHYGTGAIMAVPAHDERDFEFAKKYGLPISHVVAPHWIDPEYVPKKDKETEKREVVTIIVRNPKDGKVLCLKWKSATWQSFPTGGIDGEDLEIAARREILEETGYKNLKFIRKIPGSTFVEFWRPHKGSNVYAHFHYLVFNLENEEKNGINENEKKNHEPIWIPEEKVLDFINVENQRFMWQRLNNDGDSVFTGNGILENSDKFNGMDSEEAKKEIIKFVGGKEKTTFKLRDWVFSRQRYWGEPIPVINCEKCGLVPVPEKDLPVMLPKIKNYQPTDSGESPLANITKWVNVKCTKCKGKAKRETDTMPNWAGSSWYYLRYADPRNTKAFANKKKLKYWTSVDWYNGGNEHTTLHLLYSRFWHKFLFDLKLVPTTEPYKKRTSHGMILGEGGVKMSKSLGNVINPDEIIKIYGADTLRVYEMFMGPFNQSVAWSTESIIGARRFIEKVWRIKEKVLTLKNLSALPAGGLRHGPNFSILKLLHKTIKKVSEDIEEMHFNTAISSMMILATEMEKACLSSGTAENIEKADFEKFLQILAPFAPHITEEIWFNMGHKDSISTSFWPTWDENLIIDQEIKIVVQINGKIRAEIMVSANDNEEKIKGMALDDQAVVRNLEGRDIKKVIYIKNRLINIVV